MGRMFRTLLFCSTILLSIFNVFGGASAYATSVGVSLNVTKETVEAGEVLEVTLSLTGTEDLANGGINAFEAVIDYDRSIFVPVKESNFTLLNYWEMLEYNESTGNFVAVKRTRANSAEDIAKIALKVKEGATAQYTDIKIKDFVSSEGVTDLVLTGELEEKVQIVASTNNIPSNPSAPNKNNGVLNPNTGQMKDNGEIIKIDKLWWVPVVVLAFLIFGFFKNRTRDEAKIDRVRNGSIVAVLTILLAQSVYAIVIKGEINNDGVIDLADATVLEKHLVDLSLIPDNKFANADIDDNGELTVTDLSLLLDKIERGKNYEAKITGINTFDDNGNAISFVNKKGNVRIEIDVTTTEDLEVVAFDVDDKKYDATKLADGKYEVVVSAREVAGIQTFKVTKAYLGIGYVVPVNKTVDIEVLKKAPGVDNYAVIESVENGMLTVKFDVVDREGSFVSGSVIVTDQNNYTVETKDDIKVGANELIFRADEDVPYNVAIRLNYKLSASSVNTDTISEYKTATLTTEYGMRLSNLVSYNVNGESTSDFGRGETIILQFKGTNAYGTKIKQIVVDGRTYAADYDEQTGIYTATLIYGVDAVGSKDLVIEKVILENSKELTLYQDNAINVIISIAKPTVLQPAVLESGNNVGMVFELVDTDGAISSARAILYNEEGVELINEELNGAKLYNFNHDITDELNKKYTGKIIATYKAGPTEQKDAVLYEKTINAKAKAIVDSAQVSATKLEKGGNFSVNYKIRTNVGNVTRVNINGAIANVNASGNDFYTANVFAPQTAGKHDLDMEEIYVGNTKIAVPLMQRQIEVLKDAPNVDNYRFSDNGSNEVAITFDIDDQDLAFMSGKVKLVDANGVEIEKNITGAGKDLNFKFTVTPFAKYTIKAEIKYGRDIDKTSEHILTEEMLNQPVQLISNYVLTLTDIATYNNTEVTKFYGKNDVARVEFISDNASEYLSTAVVVDGKNYTLDKIGEKKYAFDYIVPGDAGSHDIVISDVVLSNSKVLSAPNNSKVRIEVLKDKPEVIDFRYDIDDGDVTAKFKLNDSDNAYKSGTIIVTNSRGVVQQTKTLAKDANEITFTAHPAEKYLVKVIATYDMDTDNNMGTNAATDEELFKRTIEVTLDAVELKDVKKVVLYRASGNSTTEVQSVNVQASGVPTDPQNYFAKIEMSSMPTYYANIDAFRMEDGRLKGVILQNEFIEYENENGELTRENEFTFEVPYIDNNGDIRGGTGSAREFFNRVNLDLSGSYKLTRDLDASDLGMDAEAIINGTFSGTIDGDGYKIINLYRPLVNRLNGGTIKNLTIDGGALNSNAVRGFVANEVDRSTIFNVTIKNVNMTARRDESGIVAGVLRNGTVVNGVSVINSTLSVAGGQRAGGISGAMGGNSRIENTYVEAMISSNNKQNVGGLVGFVEGGATISNAISKVKFSSDTKGNTVGGVVGTLHNNSGKLTKILSYADGATEAARIYAAGNLHSESSDLYSIVTSISRKSDKERELGEKTITESFIKDIIGFTGIDSSKDVNLVNEYNLPNYAEIVKQVNYKKENELIYYNMFKLAPFADTNLWVEMANQISGNLQAKKISFVLPLDADNHVIMGMERGDENKVKKVRVVYEDKSQEDLSVTYKKTLDNVVALYNVNGTDLQYEFNKYLTIVDENVLNALISFMNSFDYERDLKKLADKVDGNGNTQAESRLYADYYNNFLKNRLNEFARMLLTSVSNFSVHNENVKVRDFVLNDLKDASYVKKILYAYNYYDKWYNFEMGGNHLSDFMLADGYLFGKGADMDRLVSVITPIISSDYNTTRSTDGIFNNNLRNYLDGETVAPFLAGMMRALDGYENPNDWFKDHFKGYLVEQAPIARADEITYRVWDKMKTRTHLMLPILSMPEYQEDMYIIAVPTQLAIGSMNKYGEYANYLAGTNPNGFNQLKAKIDEYAGYVGNFYGVSAQFIRNSVELINNKTNIQYDTRFGFASGPHADGGTQAAGTTRDPIMKWVYEAIGSWAAANGSGAYANGTDVWWVAYDAISNPPFTFGSVFTHETAHNQDGYYFYSNRGRRWGTGAEAHADGTIAQGHGDGGMVFNIYKDYDVTADITTNLTLARIASEDLIDDYYKDMFEAGYMLDYLVGQAFLKLTPEEKAATGVRVNQNILDAPASETSYIRLSAEDFAKMDFSKGMESLWDNKIALRGTSGVMGSFNKYGGDSFWNTYWYQPHNNIGTSDVDTFKRMGQEMLGVGGYNDGFAAWKANAVCNTDLDCLRKITGRDDIDFKTYKLERYASVADKVQNNPYFDYDTIVDSLYEALKTDARNGNLNSSTNLRKLYYHIIKRATNDFLDGDAYNTPSSVKLISSAEQLVAAVKANRQGNYKLTRNIDFSSVTPIAKDGSTYYMEELVGILDGNGYKITGMSYPLFRDIQYSMVRNVTIEEPSFALSVNAAVSISSSNSIIDSVKLENSEVILPFVATRRNKYYEINTAVSVLEHKISNVAQFMAIDTTEGLRRKYVLTDDIDFAGQGGFDAVINGAFIGEIDGNGHTIKNLNNAVLFKQFNGVVKNLKISNFTNERIFENTTAAFAMYTSGAKFENVTFENVTLKGEHRVAMIGADTRGSGSTFNDIVVRNADIDGTKGGGRGVYVSALIGRKYGGSIKNAYVQGKIVSSSTEAGGVMGASEQGGQFENIISNVDMVMNRNNDGSKRNNNGGVVGNIYNEPKIKNSIMIGEIVGYDDLAPFKFSGAAEATNSLRVENCYEVSDKGGLTSATTTNTNAIKAIAANGLKDITLYRDILGFSSELWDLSTIGSDGYPTPKFGY